MLPPPIPIAAPPLLTCGVLPPSDDSWTFLSSDLPDCFGPPTLRVSDVETCSQFNPPAIPGYPLSALWINAATLVLTEDYAKAVPVL